MARASRSNKGDNKLERLREEVENFFDDDDYCVEETSQPVDVDVIELCTKMGDVSTLSDSGAFLHEYFDTTSSNEATFLGQSNKTIRSFDHIYDSDEEGEPPQGVIVLDCLSWRQDPEISLFDWKIDVVTSIPSDEQQEEVSRPVFIYSDAYRTTDQTVNICPCVEVVPVKPTSDPRSSTTYYVHKNILAMGPRRSEFFARMFLRQGQNHRGTYSRHKGLTTRMELPPMVAKEFPNLLDYIYTPELVLTLTTENATALYHLAKFLDIRSLRHETKQFWEADVRRHPREKWIQYYQYAKILRDDKILKVAIQCCVDQGFLDLGLDFYDDAKFWLDVVRNVKMNEELSLKLSQLLAMYFVHNFDTVAPGVFQELTSVRHLPYVHVDAVLALMDAEREIAAAAAAATEGATVVRPSLSEFQNRCIETIVSNWDKFDMQDPATMCLLEKQNPLVLAKLLAGAMSAAKTANQELTAQKQRLSAENTELHAAQHAAMQNRTSAYNTDRQRMALRRERLRRERDGRLKEVSACFHDLAAGNANANASSSHRGSLSSRTSTTASPSRNSSSLTSITSSSGIRSKDSTSSKLFSQ